MNVRQIPAAFTTGQSLSSNRGLGIGAARGDPLQLTFTRRVNVAYEDAVYRLSDAWRRVAQPSVIEIGRSRLVGPVPPPDEDRAQINVALWRGALRTALPMKLDIVRWSDAFGTLFELQPAHNVRPDDRYFREGNAVLDRITAAVS